jgi:ElaB/YqjD/DUF883 family membrane-anchored ribosome-binding protein
MAAVTASRAAHGRGVRRNGAADPMRATRAARAAIAKDFESLLSDAEDLLRSTADSVGEQAAAARSRLRQSVTVARDWLTEEKDSLTETGREAVAAADDYVHRKPWQVIGIAAVAAIAAGWLLGRR